MKTCAAAALFAVTSMAQGITIPATNGSLPLAGANGCAQGYFPGSDTVTYTVPYTYQQVLSIIGNYTNLTWSGSPAGSVTTNNSQALVSNDWTPGTARFYSLGGAQVIETITTYEKPEDGPYVEIHTLAPLTVSAANLSAYSAFDGQIWAPVCNGRATASNFTVKFCATNATAAATLFHTLHMTDAITVGKYLGGQNFTTCAALGTPPADGNGSSPSTSTSSPAPYTGMAASENVAVWYLASSMVALIAWAL